MFLGRIDVIFWMILNWSILNIFNIQVKSTNFSVKLLETFIYLYVKINKIGTKERENKCGTYDIPRMNKNKPGSNFWHRIWNAWDLFQQNLAWRIGNGTKVKF